MRHLFPVGCGEAVESIGQLRQCFPRGYSPKMRDRNLNDFVWTIDAVDNPVTRWRLALALLRAQTGSIEDY